MRRFLFLDIDGVLAGEDFFKNKNHKGFVDPEKVKLINQLKELDVEVVISSSWGYDNGRTAKTLHDCGLELPITGYTEHFYSDWQCRGNEIEKWLVTFVKDCPHMVNTKFGDKYRSDDYEYCILDDDCDMLLGQKDHFVQTDSYTGVTQEDIDKIKNILKNEN